MTEQTRMNEIVLKCKICGGKLEFKNKLDGILVCRNCGCELISDLTKQEANKVPEAIKQVVLETTSTKQIQKENLNSHRFEIYRFICWIVGLIAIMTVILVPLTVLYIRGLENTNMPLKYQILSVLFGWITAIISIFSMKLKFKNYLISIFFVLILLSIIIAIDVVVAYVFLLPYLNF